MSKNGMLKLMMEKVGNEAADLGDEAAFGVLTPEELATVVGGMMAEPTTCSGGNADDCGSPRC